MLTEEINAIIRSYPREKSYTLAIMQDMQRKLGYVPKESFQPLAAYLGVKAAALYAMATFYKSLSLKPKGKHIIKVCDGTACHIRGAVTLLDSLQRILGVGADETTADGFFTVETVNCLGACAIAPVMVVDEKYYPKVTAERIDGILECYRKDVSSLGTVRQCT